MPLATANFFSRQATVKCKQTIMRHSNHQRQHIRHTQTTSLWRADYTIGGNCAPPPQTNTETSLNPVYPLPVTVSLTTALIWLTFPHSRAYLPRNIYTGEAYHKHSHWGLGKQTDSIQPDPGNRALRSVRAKVLSEHVVVGSISLTQQWHMKADLSSLSLPFGGPRSGHSAVGWPPCLLGVCVCECECVCVCGGGLAVVVRGIGTVLIAASSALVQLWRLDWRPDTQQ